jgi:hypothetical protein
MEEGKAERLVSINLIKALLCVPPSLLCLQLATRERCG